MMTDRDMFAMAAMQALMSLVVNGDERYDPPAIETDFVPDEKGAWFKYGTHWTWFVGPSKEFLEVAGPPHRLITTREDRISREAYAQADALLRAKGGTEFAEQAKLSVLVVACEGLLSIIHDDLTHERQRDHAAEIQLARDAIADAKGGG